jgi:hypothetical protein
MLFGVSRTQFSDEWVQVTSIAGSTNMSLFPVVHAAAFGRNPPRMPSQDDMEAAFAWLRRDAWN